MREELQYTQELLAEAQQALMRLEQTHGETVAQRSELRRDVDHLNTLIQRYDWVAAVMEAEMIAGGNHPSYTVKDMEPSDRLREAVTGVRVAETDQQELLRGSHRYDGPRASRAVH